MPPGDQGAHRGVSRRIVLVAALGRNHVIGQDGDLPWHLPEDLKHFKRVTLGRPIVMGRKTWDTLPGPLPGRQNIVVSRDPALSAPGCDTATSLEAALAMAEGDEVMIVGGGEIYRLALSLATDLVLTRVDAAPEGDARFPEWDEAEWVLVETAHHPADERHAVAFDIVVTVCDNAAGEACPVWNGSPVTLHWGVADPAAFEDTDERRVALDRAYDELRARITDYLQSSG